MRVLGIDPGLDGAVAQFDTKNRSLVLYEIQSPAAAQGRGREVNCVALADQFDLMFGGAHHCYLEKVGARPKEGGSSAFKFGTTYGIIRGIVAAHHIPMTTVTPTRWKMSMGITSDKKGSVSRAVELFPDHADAFFGPKGGAKDGPAEAALLAYYGALQLKEIE